ncbi:hypothetical protein M9H77_17795 [Catharanthus roseus]|uniref:Uncharacterized protein n=1 Tax=Catharanthus roseus TaxID=4058 RepID=A0ACC0B5U9_CATRO|nr:hypothetical protein M9H77_17795 [Catharanthus roseus]
MARRMEEEHQGKIAIFKKMNKGLAWQVIGAQEGAFRGTKTLLFSKLQVEEAKEISLEDHEPYHKELLNLQFKNYSSNSKSYFFLEVPTSIVGVDSIFRCFLREWRIGIPLEESWVLGASDPQQRPRRIIAFDIRDLPGIKDRRRMEKEFGPILEELSISLSLNPSSLCYEVSLEELKSLMDSYTFQVSLIGDMCIIAFEGNFFILVPSMTNCLSSHFFLEDSLMSNDTSLVELNIVGLAFEFDRNSLQHVSTITSTRGRRHNMELEGQGKNVGGILILCYGDLTMSFSSNLFLFYLVFSFKELKLFLILNIFYVILVGNRMVNLFTCEIVLDIDYMLKYSSPCAFLEKQLLLVMLTNQLLPVARITSYGIHESLNESIVQNTKSCVKIENQSLGYFSLFSNLQGVFG